MVLGWFVIDRISEQETTFFADGTPGQWLFRCRLNGLMIVCSPILLMRSQGLFNGFLTELTNHNHRTPAVSVTVHKKPSKDNEGEKAKDISTLITHRPIQLTLTDNRGFEADQLDLRAGRH